MKILATAFLVVCSLSCGSEPIQTTIAPPPKPLSAMERLDLVAKRALQLCNKHIEGKLLSDYKAVLGSYVINTVDSTGYMPYTNGAAPLMLAIVPSEMLNEGREILAHPEKTSTIMRFRTEYLYETGAAMIGVNRDYILTLDIDVLACVLIHESTHVIQAFYEKKGEIKPQSVYESEYEAFDMHTKVYFKEHPEVFLNFTKCDCEGWKVLARDPTKLTNEAANMLLFRYCPDKFIYRVYGVTAKTP